MLLSAFFSLLFVVRLCGYTRTNDGYDYIISDVKVTHILYCDMGLESIKKAFIKYFAQ